MPATDTDVKAGLDSVAQIIGGSNSQFNSAKNALLSARNQLNNIPTQFADEIARIQGYTPTGDFEAWAKDTFAKMTADKQALQATLEGVLTDLGVPFT